MREEELEFELVADALPLRLGGSFKERKRVLVESFERIYLGRSMREHNGNVAAVSRHARLSWRHTNKLVQKYGLRGEQ